MNYPPLPSWLSSPRPEQVMATERIVKDFQSGIRLVLCDMPTGCGKTLVPDLVRRRMGFEKSIYVCSGLDLQQQQADDFPYTTVIKGRDNYPTEYFPDAFNLKEPLRISASDCTYYKDRGCRFCEGKDSCPYEIAKHKATSSGFVNMNSSYFLSEANYIGRFSGWEFLTIDEADTLDQQLMKFIEIRIPRRVQKFLSIHAPRFVTKVESWAEWYVQTMNTLGVYVNTVHLKDLDQPAEIQLYQRCRSLWSQLKDADGLDGDMWSYAGDDKEEIVFRPTEPSPWGMPKLFDHAKHILLMSATLLSGDVMADELGFSGDYDVIYLPSPFPVENRPIRFAPIVDMGFKNRAAGMKRLAQGVAAVMEQRPAENILVHTHTFNTAKDLQERLNSPRVLTYTGKHNRHSTLERFKKGRGMVLLAPSMERGIDLPDSECRVVIVCQLPIPFTADRQINKRVYGRGAKGHRWLRAETMRALIQMTGRGVRHESDWCHSYILDSRAPSFVDQCRREGTAPQWWTGAIERGPWMKQLGLEN